MCAISCARGGWSPLRALVRLTLGGVAGCLAIAGVMAAEAPNLPQQEAQPQPLPQLTSRTVYPQIQGPTFSWAYRGLPAGNAAAAADPRGRIEVALDRILEEKLDFDETPLRDVAMLLQTVLEVPVTLDQRALEDAGIALDSPVTGVAKGITVRSFLRRLLRPVDLGFRITDESLLISTREELQLHPELRVYPFPYGMGRGPRTDFAALIDLIQNTIQPPTWDTQGGPGSIRPLGGDTAGEPLLVVSQTADVHEEVESLLNTLHARGLAEFGDEGSPRPVTRVYRVSDEELRGELAEKLVALANAALGKGLGDGQDADASVEAVGGSVVVRSTSPGFHVRAAQLIDALQGVEVPEGGLGMGGSAGGVFGGGL